jgi:hybrid cluster-associated redox disulfide protein
MAVTTDTVLAAKIDAQALVDDVMRRWPATVGVFIRLRMKCVGCPFGVFHSIEHACQEHALQVETALAALERRLARPD